MIGGMPAYSFHVALDLYEQMRFSDLSPVMKRMLVARWVNEGKAPGDLPRLTAADCKQFRKMSYEEGFEVLQQIIGLADDAERGVVVPPVG